MLGTEELRSRLRTHLIPYRELAVGYGDLDDDVRSARVQQDYNSFLRARARILAHAAELACQGKTLGVEELSASLNQNRELHNIEC